MKREEYAKYIKSEQSGMFVTYSTDSFKYSLQYQPPELLAIESNMQSSKDSFDRDVTLYKSTANFVLAISRDGWNQKMLVDSVGSGIKDSLNTFLSYKLQNDFRLICNSDTLPCSLYLFENNGGIKNELTFSIGFNLNHDQIANHDLVLIYNDELYSRQRVEFKIKSSDLKSLPEIIF